MDVVAKAQEVVAQIRAELNQMAWTKRTQAGKTYFVGESERWTVNLWPPEATGGYPAMAAAVAKGPRPTFNTVLLPQELTDEATQIVNGKVWP